LMSETKFHTQCKFTAMQPFQHHKHYFSSYALTLPEGRAGTAWEPSKLDLSLTTSPFSLSLQSLKG
jgi:hypothetical protein